MRLGEALAEDDQFVAAQPRHGIGGADDTLGPLRNRGRRLVVGAVPEIVEVDEQHDVVLAGAGTDGLVDAQALDEVAPVWRAGGGGVERPLANSLRALAVR